MTVQVNMYKYQGVTSFEYHKNSKNMDIIQLLMVIVLKMEQFCLTVNGMANCVDPDHTALSGRAV